MTPQIEVVFQPHGKRAEFPPGVTVMEAAQALGVDISSLCGGKGKCGKCKVRVLGGDGTVSEPSDKELKHLSEEEIRDGFRLACTTRLGASTVIHVPLRSRIGRQRLQTGGLEIPVKLDPLVKKYRVTMPPPHLRDSRADEDRLLASLTEQHGLPELGIDFDVYRSLPNIVREANWDATAVVWKDRIIALEAGDTSDSCFGLAVDVGTTKLAGFLIDLKRGEVVAVAARMNPQIPFGEDVMSRVSHIMNGGWDALEKLQDAVVSGVNEIIVECCGEADARPEEIYELNFGGNTVMQ
nr:2Fe-2S iron-sulfur cluster binding domain-containing protein [Candidatus Bathyarchaeota archaeon]